MSQTIPFGPSTPVYYPGAFLPTASYEYTTVSGDLTVSSVFNCGYCNRIKVQAAATVYVQHAADGAMVKYVLIAGEAIMGPVWKIGGSSTGTTATTIVMEV